MGFSVTERGALLSYINESDARAQLESIGLLLPAGQLELAVGGKSRRCKVAGMDAEMRGWYRLSEWVADEGVFLVGTYGIFEGDDPGVRKIELSKRCADCGHEMPLKAKECPACKSKAFKSRELTPEQKAAMKAKHAEDKRRAEAERQKEIDKAARWARAVWLASDFTSDATTAKPLPASPARAASMVAFSANRLV
jgi:putative DNA primase/helicase